MADEKVERTTARIADQAEKEAEEILDARAPERMSREQVDAEIAEHEAYIEAATTERRAREARIAELGREPLERTDISTMPTDEREDRMPNLCKICGARFESKGGLESHLENFHPGAKNEAP